MDNSQYTVEDFLLDERFRKWIFDPDREDNIYWENWLQKNPKKYAELVEARKILLNLSMKEGKLSEREKTDLWKEIEEKSEGITDDLPETRIIPMNPYSILTKSAVKRPNYQWLRIASILLILAICSVIVVTVNRSENGRVEVAEAMTRKETEFGTKSHVTLRDGTTVMLNSGSKLSYLPGFTSKSRDVYLEGEAYFDVAKDSDRPFNVHTGNLVTTALGTEFNISNYPDDHTGIAIALIEGKVQVLQKADDKMPSEEVVILSPGEMARYNPSDKRMKVLRCNEKEVLAWKEGTLYFSHARESEVFKRIERWYGVKVELVNKSNKKWDYSGEYKNQNIGQVMTSLGFTMSFDYTIDDTTIYITYKTPDI